MEFFVYEAVGKDGEKIKGELGATDKREAVEILIKKKFTPLKIEKKFDGNSRSLSSISVFERFTPLDRIILARNLATIIKAGLSLSDALEILISDTDKKVTKNILLEARMNVQNGQPLSETFKKYNKLFPPIFVGMVRAGEVSGQLDKTLEELSRYLTKEYNLFKKVKSALTYPIILVIASLGVVSLLMTFVLPRLSKTFAQSKVDLPAITSALLKISSWFTYSFILDFVIFALIIWFFSYFRKTVLGKKVFSNIIFFIPVTRNILRRVVLIRLTRTLGNLMASSMSLIESLELLADTIGNERYKKATLKTIQEVGRGITLSESLKKYPELFPKLLTSLINVGEKTGTTENIMKTFADFYEEDMDNSLKDLTNFLEPALLLVMGLIIGVIAVSILMPIYQLVGKFV